jgi:hypothetical protein
MTAYKDNGLGSCVHCGRHIVAHFWGCIESIGTYCLWVCRPPDKPAPRGQRRATLSES